MIAHHPVLHSAIACGDLQIKIQNNYLQYALFGHPVSHSLSPIIHKNFAAQFNLNMEYTAWDATSEHFSSILKQFHAQGGKGANITLPLKQLAYSLCEKTSVEAELAQAVNTIYWDNKDRLCGDNTDGTGLIRDLKDSHHQVIQHKNVLILGAGGAAAGILPALLSQDPNSITLVNRTYARALVLKEQMHHSKIQVLSVEQLNQSSSENKNKTELVFDLIINATSASLQNKRLEINANIIKNKIVYDLAYNLKAPTIFVQWAQEKGAQQAYDGLGMLIEQAAQAFYIWHGQKPDTRSIRAELDATKKY